MAKDWDYSKLAHTAKLNGGPEKYLQMVKEQKLLEGRMEGKLEGRKEVLITEFIVVGLAFFGYLGCKTYLTVKDKYEKYKLNSQKDIVDDAENRLIQGMEQAVETESIEFTD